MSEVVNLRKARKDRDRRDKDKRAAENRAVHGLPKRLKDVARTERERATRVLEGHRKNGEDEDQ